MVQAIAGKVEVFSAATDGVSLERTAAGMRVVALPRQWAYAVRAAISDIRSEAELEEESGPFDIEIELEVHKGFFSAGVLSKDESGFLTEVPIPSTGARQKVRLHIDNVADASTVIIRTYAHSDTPPSFSILDWRVDGGKKKSKRDLTVVPNLPPRQEVIDPIVDQLWTLALPDFGIERLRNWSWDDLQRHLTGDKYQDNLLLNKYEFATGRVVLRSYPWRLSVPFVLCNARCDFCEAWVIKGKPMPADILDSLAPMLPYAREIDMVGWGEPLIHPEFGDILDRLRRHTDPRARIALTTNGVHLHKWVDRLIEANVRDYSISMHAATPETHYDVMGLEPSLFPQVLEGIRYLHKRRRELNRHLNLCAVFIVMRQNIAEIPRFIDLCTELGIEQVFFRTLMPQQKLPEALDYHRLPPYHHPDFERLREQAKAAIAAAKIQIQASPDTWSTPLFPEELEQKVKFIPIRTRSERQETSRRAPADLTQDQPTGQIDPSHPRLHGPYIGNLTENPYDRHPPLRCPSPYTAVYVNGFDRHTNPCCYMTQIPGYQKMYMKKDVPFEAIWNSPAMIALRESMHKGPLMGPCLKCPFYW